jgi:hypothetical protein
MVEGAAFVVDRDESDPSMRCAARLKEPRVPRNDNHYSWLEGKEARGESYAWLEQVPAAGSEDETSKCAPRDGRVIPDDTGEGYIVSDGRGSGPFRLLHRLRSFAGWRVRSTLTWCPGGLRGDSRQNRSAGRELAENS